MTDPIALFDDWFREAHQAEPGLPDAAALATADADGVPSVRMVLVRAHAADGFVFYTNLDSRKGRELAQNPRAALCFHWKSLARQVRVSGPVRLVSEAQADAYFGARDRGSQLGAWASRQSETLPERQVLEQAVAEHATSFGDGEIPRPPWWSGFAVVPEVVEFWEEMPFRLHRRTVFTRGVDGWSRRLLYP